MNNNCQGNSLYNAYPPESIFTQSTYNQSIYIKKNQGTTNYYGPNYSNNVLVFTWKFLDTNNFIVKKNMLKFLGDRIIDGIYNYSSYTYNLSYKTYLRSPQIANFIIYFKASGIKCKYFIQISMKKTFKTLPDGGPVQITIKDSEGNLLPIVNMSFLEFDVSIGSWVNKGFFIVKEILDPKIKNGRSQLKKSIRDFLNYHINKELNKMFNRKSFNKFDFLFNIDGDLCYHEIK